MAGHPVQRGMDANLGSLDRVYESWPPPGGGRGYGTKRRRWCGGTGVPGGHDTHRPFTNRKAAPGEGTVIRARVGRPVPSGARSAQGPVHFPPAWRVMMRRCHQASQDRGGGRGRRAEGWAEARAGGGQGGYPLAALGSEDWCDAIHAGVFSGGRPSVHGVAPSPTAPASSRVSRE